MWLTVLPQFNESSVRALKSNTALSFRTLSGFIFAIVAMQEAKLQFAAFDSGPSMAVCDCVYG
jgi:hypothetical protein